MLALMKRGLPLKYAGTALSMILWSWINLKLDSGSFCESWEHLPGLGSGTCNINIIMLNIVSLEYNLFHLHISDWQPIRVGSLLFLKWTLKSVQNITDLEGTDCISSNGIFWSCKHPINNLGFLPIFVTSLNDWAHWFWKYILNVKTTSSFLVKSYVSDWSRKDNLQVWNSSILTLDMLSIWKIQINPNFFHHHLYLFLNLFGPPLSFLQTLATLE